MIYSVTKLNWNCTKGVRMLRQYADSSCTDIMTAYTHPSTKKVSSFYIISNEMRDVGGYDLRITAKSKDYYSCAYRIKEDNKEYLIYHTVGNRYKLEYHTPGEYV